MKILKSYWSTNSTGTIGIVQVETLTNEIKYYIGVGSGKSESEDRERIAYYGSKFLNEAGDIIFKDM